MVSKTIQGAGLFEIDFLPVADSDNEDDEAGFVSLEDHPIGADAKSIKLFIRAMGLRMLFFNGA